MTEARLSLSALVLGLLLVAALPGCREAPPRDGPAPVGEGPALVRPTALRAAGPRHLLVVDPGQNAVLRVDLDSGRRSVAVGRTQLPFPERSTVVDALSGPRGLTCLDGGAGAVFLVDPRRGTRVLSGPGRGEGPPLVAPTRMQPLPDGKLAVLDPEGAGVVRVDPWNGDRVALAAGQEGLPRWWDAADLAVTPKGAVLVLEELARRVVALPSGEEPARVVLDLSSGEPPVPFELNCMALRPDGRVVLADQDLRLVVEADPSSRERRTLYSAGVPSPVLIRQVGDVAVLEDGSVAVSQPAGAGLVVLSASGPPRLLSGGPLPGGALAFVPYGMAPLASGEVLAADLLHRRLLRVRPARVEEAPAFEVVSGGDRGHGPPFGIPTDVAPWDPTAAFVADRVLGVVRVDLQSGDREVLSGRGPALGEVGRLVRAADRLFVLDRVRRAVLEIDPSTGDRRLLEGDGPPLLAPQALGWAPPDLLVTDGAGRALVRIDPVTGTRRPLPLGGAPAGLAVDARGGVLVGMEDSGRDPAALLSIPPGGAPTRLEFRTVPGQPYDTPVALVDQGRRILISDPGGTGNLFSLDRESLTLHALPIVLP